MTHYCGHTHVQRHYRDQDAPGRADAGRQNGTAPAKRAPAQPSHEQIATLAYSYWEAHGRQGGSQLEDWLCAERELCRKA
jgi:hypothetical protein